MINGELVKELNLPLLASLVSFVAKKKILILSFNRTPVLPKTFRKDIPMDKRLEIAIHAALEAGKAILEEYNNPHDIEIKMMSPL